MGDVYGFSYEDVCLIDSGALPAKFVVLGFGGVLFVGGVVGGFGWLEGVSRIPVEAFYHIIRVVEVLEWATEVSVIDARSHLNSRVVFRVRVVLVYHVELPGYQNYGRYK